MINRLFFALCCSCAAVAAAQAPLPPEHPPLPEGHPPLDSAPPPASSSESGGAAQPLPPGHPPLPEGHPPAASGRPAPSADELIAKLDARKDLLTQEKTFELASSLGRLYYGRGRYGDAASFFGEAVAKAAEARSLYLQHRRQLTSATPSPADLGCAPGGGATLEALTQRAREKQQPAEVAACARAALHPLMEIEVLYAHAKFLAGDTQEALAAFERQLEVFDSNPDALYGRAVLLLDTRGDDVKALGQAKADFERYLSLAPTAPRAKQARAFVARVEAGLASGGVSRIPRARAQAPSPPPAAPAPPFAGGSAGAPKPLAQETIDAFSRVERTPELEAKLNKALEEAEEHLARARFQQALDSYKQVMPFQPENGRVSAGMAWSLIGLKRQPMADRVWQVAVQRDPASVERLGDTLKAKGDIEGAKAIWSKLSQSAPQYSSSSKLAEKLK